ncbi:MAG: hypothetical protein PUH10_05310 [Erysipelotrichaceae bacterium]|uniref:hypothetical protein n=1 Tax=Floccifex sp. TaxID=2815810 RepID=UPI002A748A74|nr:hypothetical protein [Floccifex sp.]MDD7281394.1 hypothetical protein [Erysipelotrichaceae bacterium]MDY2958195.1 hypothetical protein [Floccifex sp.]
MFNNFNYPTIHISRTKALIVYVLVLAVAYYIALPPLNWHALSFWSFFGPAIIILALILTMCKKEGVRAPGKGVISFIVVIVLAPSLLGFASARFFHASEYAKRINIEDADFSTISEVDFSKTAIIDRDTTEALGDRVMGQMSDWVSQFEVSDEYTQISYKDSVYRVTPLEYADFFKWWANQKDGIPAYITVDSTNGTAKLVRLSDLGYDNMKYVPSSLFNKNLMRHLRFQYPTEIFGSPSFEIDEEGRPWYVCTTYSYKLVGNKKYVTGAVFMDPITGESKKYDVDSVPTWSDRIFPESLVIEEIDDYGSLQKGFINSMIGQKGVIKSSSGYNYIEKDGDIWLYTGITSVNSDSSNLGFVLVNLRTHEALRIDAPGANETSAMKSAEDEVQNYGYEATFPVLVNVNGYPTYLMSLRSDTDNSSQSVLKMYAMVDATDYQKVTTVSVDQGLNVLKKQMIALQGKESNDQDVYQEKTIKVNNLNKVFVDGNTIYYFEDENGKKYRMDFTTKYEEQLAFLKNGDNLTIEYLESDGIQIVSAINNPNEEDA